MNDEYVEWHTFQGIDWCVDADGIVWIAPAVNPESGYTAGELWINKDRPAWNNILDRAISNVKSTGDADRIAFLDGVRGYGSWNDAFYDSEGSKGLEAIDFSGLNTSEITDMTAMFANCYDLKSLVLGAFDTSNVQSMTAMFQNCQSLVSLDLDGFNTSKVRYMALMFSGCSNLVSVNLNSFDTSRVKEMSGMFSACSSLQSLDLSSFNTSNVESMGMLLSNCTSLTSLDLSSFDMSCAGLTGRLINRCHALRFIAAPNWDFIRKELSSVAPKAIVTNLPELIRKEFSGVNSEQTSGQIECAENVASMLERGLSIEDITGRSDWWNTEPVYDEQADEWYWH